LALGTGAFLVRAAARRLGLALCPESRWPPPLRGPGGEVAPAAALSALGAHGLAPQRSTLASKADVVSAPSPLGAASAPPPRP